MESQIARVQDGVLLAIASVVAVFSGNALSFYSLVLSLSPACVRLEDNGGAYSSSPRSRPIHSLNAAVDDHRSSLDDGEFSSKRKPQTTTEDEGLAV